MSSNPFRKSSLKDSTNDPSGRADLSGTVTVPLSVDTRVPSSSQKHVNFASPPAVPISPASYPSSPESTRQSPAFRASFLSQAAAAADYSQAIRVDPFQETVLDEEDDRVIEEALQNARANSDIGASAPQSTVASGGNAVKDTLSRFASGPRRATSGADVSPAQDQTKPQKQALDVDAFKRLLLTGQSGAHNVAPVTAASQQPASDSSSIADTASLSQKSLIEGMPQTVEETPRSSYEQDRNDPALHRPQTQEARRRPPPPKPRYGKPISELSGTRPTPTLIPFNDASLDQPTISLFDAQAAASHVVPQDKNSQSELKKRPPTPPLTRRKSHNKTPRRPDISRNTSSRHSINSESDEAASPSPTTLGPVSKMVPPPPPLRRLNSQSARRPPPELPATMEEDSIDMASLEARTPASDKRISLGPPPLPPPRKNLRGSSRSSVDSQRPSMAQLGITGSARSSGEYRRPNNASPESRSVSGASNATDILADLAALQREVDAARGTAGR